MKRQYEDVLPTRLKLKRAFWHITYLLLYRLTPQTGFNGWRIGLLRLFGATIGKGCRVAPTARIWLPSNLVLGDQVCLAEQTDIYSVAPIHIGSSVAISQRTFLCTASHNIALLSRPLITGPITIGDHAWVCAEAFIGMNVNLGEGAVVGARAVVNSDVSDWTVVAGNPAREIRKRLITDDRPK